jgi:hypothetical protein
MDFDPTGLSWFVYLPSTEKKTSILLLIEKELDGILHN